MKAYRNIKKLGHSMQVSRRHGSSHKLRDIKQPLELVLYRRSKFHLNALVVLIPNNSLKMVGTSPIRLVICTISRIMAVLAVIKCVKLLVEELRRGHLQTGFLVAITALRN